MINTQLPRVIGTWKIRIIWFFYISISFQKFFFNKVVIEQDKNIQIIWT